MKRLLLILPLLLLLLGADAPKEIDGWKVVSGEWKPAKKKAWQTDSGSLKYEGDTAQAGSIRLSANLYIMRWNSGQVPYVVIIWGDYKRCLWITDKAVHVGAWGERGADRKRTPWLAPLKKPIPILLQIDGKKVSGNVGQQKIADVADLESVFPIEIRVDGAEVVISDLSVR